MKHILAPILLLTLLFPSLALGEGGTIWDLVVRDGLYYKKFTDVPFTGKITGKKQGLFRNGKRHGPWVEYDKNGQLRYKGTYKNGVKEGPYVSYYENGQLESKGSFKNDKSHGPYVSYHENGQLSRKGTYKNGHLWLIGPYKNGVKVK